MVLQGEVQGPAVATGTTVTSANSGARIDKFPCIPVENKNDLIFIFLPGVHHS